MTFKVKVSQLSERSTFLYVDADNEADAKDQVFKLQASGDFEDDFDLTWEIGDSRYFHIVSAEQL